PCAGDVVRRHPVVPPPVACHHVPVVGPVFRAHSVRGAADCRVDRRSIRSSTGEVGAGRPGRAGNNTVTYNPDELRTARAVLLIAILMSVGIAAERQWQTGTWT